MAINLKCECGEIYRADESQIGFSIQCRNCNRVIPIGASKISQPSTSQGTIFDNVTAEPKRPLFGHIVIPIAGILALVVGIALTVSSLRRTSDSQATINVAQDSVPSLPNSQNTVINNNASRLADDTDISSKKVTPLANASNQIDPSTFESESPVSTSPESLPVSTQTPMTVRYATGKNLVAPQNTGGRGTLRISNGTTSDAIAKLVDATTNKTVRLTYIQANSDLTISNIKVGKYILKFSLGDGYIAEQGKFQLNQSFTKFDDFFDFTENRTGNRIEWDTHSVTLNKVLNGNAPTSSIGEADFEDY